MSIRPKHLQFCLYYLQTNEPAVAYSMTYPKASTKSLYAAASRLLARPDVTAWINETRYRMQERLLQEIEEKEVTQKKEELLSINQKRAVLTRIINGETRRTRHIKTKYGCTKVQDDLPIYAVLRAIDMDTRLENFQNYLLHRDSWGKSPSLYINTPTLQQQVNILIAQASAYSSPPTEGQGVGHLAPDQTTPVIATQEATSRNTVLPTMQPSNSTPHVIAGRDQLSHETPNKLPLLDKEGRMAVPSPTEKSHSGEVPPAQDNKTMPLAPSPWERAGGEVSHLTTELANSLTPLKTPINRLTLLNKTSATRTKTPRYIYNKHVTSPPAARSNLSPSPWERRG